MLKMMRAAPGVPPRQAYYGLFLLWLVYVFANIDRFAIGIALQEIKKDLLLTDTQLGMISGLFFIVPYIVFGFPISRWLDRGVRRNILAWSVGFWSLMASATGAAVGFVQLALARAGLGAGEAACIPAAVSLIGDLFHRSWRSQAIGIFNSGLAIAGFVGTPILGMMTDHYGWRVALISFGAVGLLVALLIALTLKEPPRAAIAEQAQSGEPAGERKSVLESLRIMFAIPTFRYLVLGHGIYGIGIFSWVSWYGVSLIRTYGMTYTEIGFFIGTGLGMVMLLSGVGSGFLCPLVARRTGNDRWMVLLPAIACLASVPALAVTGFAVPQWLAMASGAAVLAMTAMRTAPLIAVTMDLLPSAMHGLATMVFVTLTSHLGAAIGPILVGIASDSVKGSMDDAAALRYGLLVTGPVFGLIGALIAFVPAFYLRRNGLAEESTVEPVAGMVPAPTGPSKS